MRQRMTSSWAWRIRRPGGNQLVVIGQRPIGDHVAFFFAAGGHFGQAHTLGGQVTFEATQRDRIDQSRPLTGQAQGRFRQACTLQRTHIFAGDFRFVAGTDEGLIVFEQRVVLFAGAIQGVAQGQAAGGVIGFGSHQRFGTRHRLVGFAGVGLGQRQTQLQVRVVRLERQGLVVDLGRSIPTLEIAIGPRSGGQGLQPAAPRSRPWVS